jgi:hypothetical protein
VVLDHATLPPEQLLEGVWWRLHSEQVILAAGGAAAYRDTAKNSVQALWRFRQRGGIATTVCTTHFLIDATYLS